MNGEKERMEKASAQQAERITVLEKQCEEQQAARWSAPSLPVPLLPELCSLSVPCLLWFTCQLK